MADEADRAEELIEREMAVRRAAIPPLQRGAPGECGHCGESVPRLVNGACPRCRDKLGLP